MLFFKFSNTDNAYTILKSLQKPRLCRNVWEMIGTILFILGVKNAYWIIAQSFINSSNFILAKYFSNFLFTILIFFSQTLLLYRYFQVLSDDILYFSEAGIIREIFFKTIFLFFWVRTFDRARTFTRTFDRARPFTRTFDRGVVRRQNNDLKHWRLLLMLWWRRKMMIIF